MSSIDEIIEIYMRDVDVSLLEENLRLTIEQRLIKMQNFARAIEEMQTAVAEARERA